jgi:hypothetical protein
MLTLLIRYSDIYHGNRAGLCRGLYKRIRRVIMDATPKHIDSIDDNHEVNRKVSIWLDTYDDIFSDFDPRPFSERALSDDFISELKKVSREDSLSVSEMKLLVPEKNRKPEEETIIIKRLHSYFRGVHSFMLKSVKKIRLRGISMVFTGVVMLFLAALIVNQSSTQFGMKLLLILCEPAGWFFMWTGFDTIFFSSRQTTSQLEFYNKLLKSKITFGGF